MPITNPTTNTVTPFTRELVFLTEQTGKDEAVLLSEALRLGLELLYRNTVEQKFLTGRLTRSEAVTIIGEKAVTQIEQRAKKPPLQVNDLNAFFADLPRLGEDAEAFAKDVESVRSELPLERDPWA